MIIECYYVVAEYIILLQYVVTSNNIIRKRRLFSTVLSSGVLRKPKQTAYATPGVSRLTEDACRFGNMPKGKD